MQFYGKQKQYGKIMTAFCIAAAVLAAYNGFIHLDTSGPTFFLCSFVILALGFYKVIPIITENGADSCISIFGIRFHGIWMWKDVNYIYADFTKSYPDVVLIITRKRNNRRFLMERSCIQQIIDLATYRNPRITVEVRGNDNITVKGGKPVRKGGRTSGKSDKASAASASAPHSFHELAEEARKIRDANRAAKSDKR